jgi:hypothetical protein
MQSAAKHLAWCTNFLRKILLRHARCFAALCMTVGISTNAKTLPRAYSPVRAVLALGNIIGFANGFGGVEYAPGQPGYQLGAGF